MPVHLTHGAWLDVQVTSSNGLGDGEVLAVHNARLTAAALVGGSIEHVMGVLVLGLFERRWLLLVDALGYRAWKIVSANASIAFRTAL